MRIFSSGDFHGDKRLAERLAQQAMDAHADLVILCGDLTQADTDPTNLIGPFTKRGLRVAFVHGNHESPATAQWWSELYGVTHLHGKGRMYQDIGVFGVGGANIGWQALDEETLFGYLSTAHNDITRANKKILVSHVHPTGSAMEKMTAFFPGSTAIRKAIDTFKPDIALCCHVHEAAGLEEKIGGTTLINVCRQAKIIDL